MNVVTKRKPIRLHPIVRHLLYGDIQEMPLSVLKNECPTNDAYNKFDEEQLTRIAAAATVQAWIEGKLHKSGYIWDKNRHRQKELLENNSRRRI